MVYYQQLCSRHFENIVRNWDKDLYTLSYNFEKWPSGDCKGLEALTDTVLIGYSVLFLNDSVWKTAIDFVRLTIAATGRTLLDDLLSHAQYVAYPQFSNFVITFGFRSSLCARPILSFFIKQVYPFTTEDPFTSEAKRNNPLRSKSLKDWYVW